MDNNTNPVNAAVVAAQNSNQPTTQSSLVPASSINEFRAAHGGRCYAHHQDLKDSQGNPFVKSGIRFGQCFAAFSKAVVDGHEGKTPVEIAKDVIANPQDYQVRQSADKDTKEPLFNAAGQPIMLVDYYKPFGKDDEEL